MADTLPNGPRRHDRRRGVSPRLGPCPTSRCRPRPSSPAPRTSTPARCATSTSSTEGPHAGRLLMVASDRISIFDFVLDTTIPDKGELLTRMSLWWFEQLADLVPNHVVSTDVPEQVRGRAVVCERLEMYPGRVRGPRLPDRLRAARLPRDRRGLRHPAARGARGRQPAGRADLHAGHQGRPRRARRERVVRRRGRDGRRRAGRRAARPDPRGLRAGPRGSPASAASSWPTPSSSSAPRGDGTTVLADEVLTPDSSRFWPAAEWQPGRAQPSYDKQIVRNWAALPGVRLGPRLRRAPAAAARRGRRAHPRAVRRGLRAAHRHSLLMRRFARSRGVRRAAARWPSTTSSTRVTGPSGSPRSGAVSEVDGEPRVGQTWVDETKPGLKPRMRTTELDRPSRWSESGTWRFVARRPDPGPRATGAPVRSARSTTGSASTRSGRSGCAVERPHRPRGPRGPEEGGRDPLVARVTR